MDKVFNQPFSVLWRTALIRAPRLVPDFAIRFTSPDGPQPVVVQLPSRGRYTIPLYVFVPDDITPEEARSLPVLIDFHGGGFFQGSCMEQAPFCAQACREFRGVAISVDYRMGPINKFPTAIEDAEDVLSALLDKDAKGYTELRQGIENKIFYAWRDRADTLDSRALPENYPIGLDISRIAISGFSSGGNLALNLALSIKEPQEGAPWPSRIPQNYPYPIPLLLYYPSFDSRLLPSERTRPPQLPVGSNFWSDVSDALHPTYLPREQAGHPRASPGLAHIKDDGLHPQARMLLVLPELDTLAEQSEAWVKKVQEEGRADDLRVERFPGMKHGWTQFPDSMLETDEERSTKQGIHNEAIAFVRGVWAGNEMVSTS